MAIRVGIGIITFNRQDVLAETLARVRAHTTTPCALAVADDGSTDGTAAMVRSQNITLVTGRNMGIAWNKNRALFLLSAVAQCDVVILLEDDSFPIRDGWQEEWMLAAERWGHVNLAGEWFKDSFLKGSGTVDDPILATSVSAQCSGFSPAANTRRTVSVSHFWYNHAIGGVHLRVALIDLSARSRDDDTF